MGFQKSDIELIRQVLHEDKSSAFEELMQRYLSQVYNASIRLVKEEQEAEDIVQLTFIQAYKKLDSWRGENFGAWLTVIAKHIALRQLEQKRRRKEVSLDENDTEDRLQTNPNYIPDEDYDEAREQRLQRLEEAISQLPYLDRQIVQQYYYDRIPLKEIAQRLQQTENNVKVRLFRIREKLKKKITDTE